MEHKELFMDKITKGDRTFFFDFKQLEDGDVRLSVSESKTAEDGSEQPKTLIVELDYDEVKDFLGRVIKRLEAFSALSKDQ